VLDLDLIEGAERWPELAIIGRAPSGLAAVRSGGVTVKLAPLKQSNQINISRNEEPLKFAAALVAAADASAAVSFLVFGNYGSKDVKLEVKQLNGVDHVAALSLKSKWPKNGAPRLAMVLIGALCPLNSTLTELDLCDNAITPAGVGPLAEMLRANGAMAHLNLTSNKIGDKGAELLAQALHVNSSLKALGLGENSIEAVGAGALARALCVESVSLTLLDLIGNKLGPTGANALAPGLAGGSLTAINVLDNQLDAASIKTLANIAHPKGLSLCGGILRGQATAKYSKYQLDPGVGTADAILLASDLSLPIVSGSLTDLDLSRSTIGSEGAMALGHSLRGNTALTSLNLSENCGPAPSPNRAGPRTIDPFGTGIASLAEWLNTNRSLTRLNLRRTYMDAASTIALSRALHTNKGLTSLDLSKNALFGIDVDTSQEFSKGAYSAEAVVALQKALQANTTLTTVKLTENGITRDGAALLASVSREKSISLCGIAIDESELSMSFGTYGDHAIGHATLLVPELARSTALKRLDLDGGLVGPLGLEVLAEGLQLNTTLTALDLSRANVIGNPLREAYNPVGIQALAAAMRDNTTLTELNLSRNRLCGVWDEWKRTGPFDETYVVHGDFTAIGVLALADLLRWNITLQVLNLSGNGLHERDKLLVGPDLAMARQPLLDAKQLQDAERSRPLRIIF
jgi:Ran GTPase-activating protein (RanGAP) involved in mRNA processing and transport